MQKLGRAAAFVPFLAWVVAVCLLLFQAYAFYSRLPLSLGPRVILQPWLQRIGYLPYEEIADLHMPLMPLLLQAPSFLGLGELQVAKLAVVGLQALTTLLTFFFARRLIGQWSGLWAIFFLVLWAPVFHFGKLWHESFLAPAYLLYLFFIRPVDSPRPISWSILLGLLGGVTFLIKQHAVLVFAAFLLWDFAAVINARRAIIPVFRALFGAGLVSLLPFLAYCGYQWMHVGTLKGFFYWTFEYNLVDGTYKNLAALSPSAGQVALLFSCALFFPAAVLCILNLWRKGGESWRTPALWLVLMAAASVTAYPRYATFHLQPALPFLALLSAFAISQLKPSTGISRWSASGLVLAVFLYWLATVGPAYRPVFDHSIPRVISEYSPLTPLADEIREEIGPAQKLFIFMDDESLSNLYYLTGSPPPRFWIFHYPWYMIEPVKARILEDLRTNPPDWVVYSPKIWGAKKYAPELNDYILKNYHEQRSLKWNGGNLYLLKRR